MDRRRFLQFLGAGVAGIALEKAIPFNRVWSFPKEIVIPTFVGGFDLEYYEEDLTIIKSAAQRSYGFTKIVTIRFPQCCVRSMNDPEFIEAYSGGPPGLPPVAQLKSLRVPDLCPALGIPES